MSQVAPSNKPTAATQAPAATATLLSTPPAYPAGTNINYIRTKVASAPITDETTFNTSIYTDVKEVTQYIDGLGRPIQTVNRQASSDNAAQDIVVPQVYDSYGRDPYKFLPYVASTSDGSFKIDPFTDQKNFSQNQYPGEQVFYGKTIFETSPINRINKTFAPGNSWAGSEGSASEQAGQMQYLVNTTADQVRIWNINNYNLNYNNSDEISVNIPTTTSIYNDGTLYKNITLDEHGNAVVEYKDKGGLVILKKVQIGAVVPNDYSGYDGFLCTYYIYDDLSQLRFVIQPKAVAQLISSSASWQLTTTMINELCFRYEYDERQRMVAKKVPGAGWVYMLYDKRDRLVYTQDANLRQQGQWHVTLYDMLDRPIVTGILYYNLGRNSLKPLLDQTDPSLPANFTISGHKSGQLQGNIILSTEQSGLQRAATSISMENGFSTTGDFIAEITYTTQGDSFADNTSVTGNSLPSGYNFIALTATQYDSYDGIGNSYTTQYNNKMQMGNLSSDNHAVSVPSQANTQTRGLVTAKKVRVLENPNNLDQGNWLYSASFYDDHNRIIQGQSLNYKGGTDIITTQYDFIGNTIRTYVVNQNPASNTNTGTLGIMSYDHLDHLVTTIKAVFNNSADALQAIATVTSQMQYNELGQLTTKNLGRQKDYYNRYTYTPLEVLDYSYNIRGWLKGINKDYANKTGVHANDRYFGMELNYDWGFTNKQYNGNISGMKWRGKGDGEQRSYGFNYDKLNRLIAGDFSQYDGTVYGDNVNNINFDMIMGDGVNASSAYDENGNILAMKQWGLKVNSSTVIDNLSYNYGATSTEGNKLLSVTEDPSIGGTDNKLGDFTDNNTTGDDYTYDANGNLLTDKNKRITGLVYNHLNLPWQIVLQNADNTDKGIVTYIYDATGNKLEKRVQENALPANNNIAKNTTTDYIAGAVFENNLLQFILHEEGRIRFISDNGSGNSDPCGNTFWQIPNGDGTIPPPPGACNTLLPTPPIASAYQFDYFVKDHLGNIRTVLTDEQRQDKYPVASMEPANATVENTYYSKIEETRTPINSITGYPTDTYTNPNEQVAKLNGSGNKIGPGITLKVMAGDKFNIRVSSWYKTNGASPQTPNSPISDLLSLLNTSVGAIAGNHANAAQLTGGNTLSPAITDFLYSQPDPGGKPKAYLNWLLFDEQFKLINTSSGADPVGNDQEFKVHNKTDLPVDKNGYLYIYVSNTTPNIDVFFDNLQVTHTRGPLVEEDNYYPFGLSMAGINSKALSFGGTENRIKFQGQELQSKEFSDGSGLETYEFKYRMDDPQTGRFWSVDPLADKYVYNSPYAFSENKVTNNVELEGLESVESEIANEWRRWGVTDNKESVKPVMQGALNAAINPKSWFESYAQAGQMAIPPLLMGIMTGGFGEGGILEGETRSLRLSPLTTEPLGDKWGEGALYSSSTKTTTLLGTNQEGGYLKFLVNNANDLNLNIVANDANPGGFRFLKADVSGYNFNLEADRELFWNTVDKPFVDKAIANGDRILMVDNPFNTNAIFPGGDKSLGYNFYGRESDYLLSKGYQLINGEATNLIQDWHVPMAWPIVNTNK